MASGSAARPFLYADKEGNIMPFGLDPKSVVVGGLLAYFVVPYVLGAIAGRRSAPATA